MKIIRVQYKVKPEYVVHNQENIKAVMADLRKLNNPNIKYTSFLLDDGQTFMHFAMYPDEATSQILNGVESFNKFRQELKASEPIEPPVSVNMSMVASAYDIFEG